MTLCDQCGAELQIGDYPFCGGDPAQHQPYAGSITPDDIPGGLEIYHGLCNEDGSPRRYYSRSEIEREAKQRGMTNYVRHVDGDKHVSRWI
jgi:hypothetical protein